jgi:hypothetical protein
MNEKGASSLPKGKKYFTLLIGVVVLVAFSAASTETKMLRRSVGGNDWSMQRNTFIMKSNQLTVGASVCPVYINKNI